jgi:hypothetical protein
VADPMSAAASAEHWERLAVESEQLAAWDRERGIDLARPGSSAGDHRATTYRATAKALRLEAETGRPHCSSCFGAHANHQHGHRG